MTTHASTPPAASQVHDFWFATLSPGQWFKQDAAVDRTIAERFGALV